MWLFLMSNLGRSFVYHPGKKEKKGKEKGFWSEKKASKIKSGLLLQLLKVVYYCKSQEL